MPRFNMQKNVQDLNDDLIFQDDDDDEFADYLDDEKQRKPKGKKLKKFKVPGSE